MFFYGVVLIITKANLGILLNLDFNKGDITMVFGMFHGLLTLHFKEKKT